MDGTIDTDAAPNGESKADERYGLIDTGNAEWLVYDRQQPTAWVQSDSVVEVSQ